MFAWEKEREGERDREIDLVLIIHALVNINSCLYFVGEGRLLLNSMPVLVSISSCPTVPNQETSCLTFPSNLSCLAFKSLYDTFPYSRLNSIKTLTDMASILLDSALLFPHKLLIHCFWFLLILFLLFEDLFQHSISCIKVSSN